MVDTREALRIVLEHADLSETLVTSLPDALQKTLRADLTAPSDHPAYNRAAMDGICFHLNEQFDSAQDFQVVRSIFPGEDPGMLGAGESAEIMTGAALPAHANAVVPYEWLSPVEVGKNCRLLQNETSVKLVPGMNIHSRGSDCKAHDVLLRAGIKLGIQQVQMMYALGIDSILTDTRPDIGIISSGNELKENPQHAYEIRPGNLFFLRSILNSRGYRTQARLAGDSKEAIHNAFDELEKNCEILLSTGAVSKGKADFIPEILKERGYHIVFHGVKQRPGNPLLFARHEQSRTIVFALPGNPVAVMASTLFYILPFLGKKSGLSAPECIPSFPLSQDFEFNKPLTRFLNGKLENTKNGLQFRPISGNGSGDLITPGQSDGFMVLPAERNYFRAGESFPFLAFNPFP